MDAIRQFKRVSILSHVFFFPSEQLDAVLAHCILTKHFCLQSFFGSGIVPFPVFVFVAQKYVSL